VQVIDAPEAPELPELAEVAEPETPGGEASAEAPPTPDVAPELTDDSIDADAVAPEEQGPGDSDGMAPASPDEAETDQQ
jgi:hypothetical protein